MLPEKFVYIAALIPFTLLFLFIFVKRKDLRKEMLQVGVVLGLLNVIISYFGWWNDWWAPTNMTATKVGIEDFLLAYSSCGIMAVMYAFLFSKRTVSLKSNTHSQLFRWGILFFAVLECWVLIYIGVSGFWSSIIAMASTLIFFIVERKDLLLSAIYSGVLMLVISFLFYIPILVFHPSWIEKTFLDGLSGLRFVGVPIEEFIFWLFAGFWISTAYKYLNRLRFESVKRAL